VEILTNNFNKVNKIDDIYWFKMKKFEREESSLKKGSSSV